MRRHSGIKRASSWKTTGEGSDYLRRPGERQGANSEWSIFYSLLAIRHSPA